MTEAFDYNNLFSKAQLYIERANEADREGDLYPFWLSLSLEFLIRSSLAKIHPALLADTPNSNDYNSLLYAFGYEVTNQPKSIQITTAINRLGDLVNEFTKAEQSKARLIIDKRNTELHSGLRGFADFSVSNWINDFYRICHILLTFQDLKLDDLFGEDEAQAARIMIEEGDANIKRALLDRIEAYKKVFAELSPEEINARLSNSERELRRLTSHAKKVKCPCCGNDALLAGERISVSKAKLVDGEIYEEIRYLPSKLACLCCGLKIETYQQLKVVNLGSVFTKSAYLDPVEYLGIEPEEYIDIDALVERHIAQHGYGQEYMDE